MSSRGGRVVSARELELLQRANAAFLTPRITRIVITTEEPPPVSVQSFVDAGHDIAPFEASIAHHIHKLHRAGILHGHLHADNILLHPRTGVVKVVNLGRAMLHTEVDEAELGLLNQRLEPPTPFRSLADVLRWEASMWRNDVGAPTDARDVDRVALDAHGASKAD